MWIDHRGMVGQLSDEGAIMCPLMRLVSLAVILTVAGYWEWAAAHEIVHALGYVDACAPNYEATRPANVGDDPSDLMYAGSAPWNPTTVDPGQDDYYGANLPVECPRNLFFSAFLEPRDGTELPPNF